MAEENQRPGLNPGLLGSLEGVLKAFEYKIKQNLDGAMWAKVVSYDRKSNRAVIQPLSRIKGSDGQEIDRAAYPSVPVIRPGGGGGVVSFPLNVGDVGILFAGDRDVSSIMTGDFEKQDIPPTNTMHSFSNGFFLPDSSRNWDMPPDDSGNVYIGMRDGAVKISLSDKEIQQTAAEKITLKVDGSTITIENDTITLATGSVSAVLDGSKVTINGDVEINGSLSFSGDGTGQGSLSITGTVTGQAGGKFGGVDVKSHVHGGVQSGGSNTTAPV